MKINAVILLISFAAFLTETVQLTIACTTVSPKTTCCAANHKKSCAGVQEKKCMQTQGQRPGNSEKDKCNHAFNCENCPLCMMFIPDNFHVQNNVPAIFKIKYALFESDCISNYIPELWKPPNVG